MNWGTILLMGVAVLALAGLAVYQTNYKSN